MMSRHAVLDNKAHRDLRVRTDAGADLGARGDADIVACDDAGYDGAV